MLWIPTLPLSANTMKVWSVAQRRFFPAKPYKKAKDKITAGIRAVWEREPFECPVALTVVFHLKKPLKRWDLDNHLKAVKDAMTGIVYVDDSQVICCRCDKVKTAGIEGFEFEVLPENVTTAIPYTEPYKRPEPAEKRFQNSEMTAEEFNRRYHIPKPLIIK